MVKILSSFFNGVLKTFTNCRPMNSKKNITGRYINSFFLSTYAHENVIEVFRVSPTGNSFKQGLAGRLKASTG